MSNEVSKKMIDYIVPVLLAVITILLTLFTNEVHSLSNSVTDLKVSIGSITTELKNQREDQNKLRADFDEHQRIGVRCFQIMLAQFVYIFRKM